MKMNKEGSSGSTNGDLSIEEIEKVLFNLENNPTMPLDILESDLDCKEESNESKDTREEEDDDDDIQVVKADIYKFHGQTEQSLDQQVSEGILKFEYRDEDDDDILEIEVIDKSKHENEEITLDKDSDSDDDEDVIDNSKNENAEITFDKHSEVDDDEEEDSKWKKNVGRILNCEDGSFMPKSKFADHKEEKHPAKKRKFKEFSDGNFFMMAD